MDQAHISGVPLRIPVAPESENLNRVETGCLAEQGVQTGCLAKQGVQAGCLLNTLETGCLKVVNRVLAGCLEVVNRVLAGCLEHPRSRVLALALS